LSYLTPATDSRFITLLKTAQWSVVCACNSDKSDSTVVSGKHILTTLTVFSEISSYISPSDE